MLKLVDTRNSRRLDTTDTLEVVDSLTVIPSNDVVTESSWLERMESVWLELLRDSSRRLEEDIVVSFCSETRDSR